MTNSALAKKLGLSENAIYDHIKDFREMGKLYPEHSNNVDFFLPKIKNPFVSLKWAGLDEFLPPLMQAASTEKIDIKVLWDDYIKLATHAYTYHSFKVVFLKWRKEGQHNLYAHKRVKSITQDDEIIFQEWLKGSDHNKWRMAIAITESFNGIDLMTIFNQIKVSNLKTLQRWIKVYNQKGIAGLERQPNHIVEFWKNSKEERKNNLMKLIHETPKLHGINRASWRLLDLSRAYLKHYGSQMSPIAISRCLRENGYRFKKTRTTLTSTDPRFREKLNNIKSILSNLQKDEKFFSIDEFGPCSVKMKVGRSYVKPNALKSVPQKQKSKGWFICTAALELSTNQITHFFSRKKDTVEMIKLIDTLLLQYPLEKKLYFSWDAASWHASIQLKKHIENINILAETNLNVTPRVELAPLPATAQFLNVIESVFSGLAKSIIHNSDYGSLDECTEAISRYFYDRNLHFLQYPKRAGKMIWGNELVKPVFNEANNCKDLKYR